MSLIDGLLLGGGNLVPLVGLLLFGWSLPQIILVYWIETAIVGVVGAFKIRTAIDLGGVGSAVTAETPRARVGPHVSVVAERPGRLPHRGSGGWSTAALWLTVYLVFWAILGTFVIQIVNGGFYRGASTTGFTGVPVGTVLGGVLGLAFWHVFGYWRDWIQGEAYLTTALIDLMRPPFARPIVLIGAIAVGGVGTALIGAPVGFLVAMVLAKTAIELWWARPTPMPSPPTSVPAPPDVPTMSRPR